MDRGVWRVTVHEITKSQTRLSDNTFTFTGQLRKGNWRGALEALMECGAPDNLFFVLNPKLRILLPKNFTAKL